MNTTKQEEIPYGIATSAPQHETPSPADLAFINYIRSIIENNSPQVALNLIMGSDYQNEETSLSGIGLNLQSIKNRINSFIKKKDFVGGVEMVKSIADVLNFGIDNDAVFDKYINLLKIFNFKYLRISLNWNTILDKAILSPKEEGIVNYKQKCQRLLDNGIEPIVTFSHFETLGINPNEEVFKFIFDDLASQVLEALIPIDVKYWIAFNEPAVHSGAINFGFWGKGGYGPINLYKHFKTINRFGELSRDFYRIAHRVNLKYMIDLKVIAAFNVAHFNPGIAPTPIDKALIYLANKIDKDAQVNSFKNDDGTMAYDWVSFHPYQIFNYAVTNRLLRDLSKKLTGKELFNDTSNPDFSDPSKARVGTNGQILYPAAIGPVVNEMRKRAPFDDLVVTETGADINWESQNGIVDKTWYIKEVRKELHKLRKDGINIPFALIWTLIRMWEIFGPFGGGVGNWDFAILGEPLKKDEIAKQIEINLGKDPKEALLIAERIEKSGNTPIRLYNGMIDQLNEIFADGKIQPDQFVEALLSTKDSMEITVDILQALELKRYYENADDSSVEFFDEVLQILMEQYKDPLNSENENALVEA